MVARLVRDQEARSSNLRTPTTKAAGASSPAAFVRRVPVVRLRASWRTRRSLVWELRSAAACGRERRDAISAAAPFLGLSLYGEVRERHLRQGGAKRRGPEFKSPHSDHKSGRGIVPCRFCAPSSGRSAPGLLANQAQLGLGIAVRRCLRQRKAGRNFRSRAVSRAEPLRRGPGTAFAARRREAKRPGVQISALRPRRSSLRTARKQRLQKQSLFSHLCFVAPPFKIGPASLGSDFV